MRTARPLYMKTYDLLSDDGVPVEDVFTYFVTHLEDSVLSATFLWDSLVRLYREKAIMLQLENGRVVIKPRYSASIKSFAIKSKNSINYSRLIDLIP